MNTDSASSNDIPLMPDVDTDTEFEQDGVPNVVTAEFVLRMLEDNKLNQVQLQSVMEGTNSLLRDTVNRTLESVNHLLRQSGCDHSVIVEELKLDNMSENVFHQFRDQYNQRKYFKEHFSLIMPQKIELPFLPTNFSRRKVGQDQHLFNEKYVFVSLLDQIELLLNIPEICNMINSETTTQFGNFMLYYICMELKKF
jgi:hypothetical protein